MQIINAQPGKIVIELDRVDVRTLRAIFEVLSFESEAPIPWQEVNEDADEELINEEIFDNFVDQWTELFLKKEAENYFSPE